MRFRDGKGCLIYKQVNLKEGRLALIVKVIFNGFVGWGEAYLCYGGLGVCLFQYYMFISFFVGFGFKFRRFVFKFYRLWFCDLGFVFEFYVFYREKGQNWFLR